MGEAEVNTNSRRTLVFQMYANVFEKEKHCNSMQNWARSLSSGWFLTAMAGMGFLLSRDRMDSPFAKCDLLLLITTLAAVGIFVLFVLDQVLYRNLLSGVVLSGLVMEHYYAFLPRISSSTMMISKTKGDVGWRNSITLFYLAQLLALSVVSVIILVGYWAEKDGDSALFCFLLTLVPILALFYCYYRERTEDPRRNHSLLHDEHLKDILNKEAFEQIVNAFEVIDCGLPKCGGSGDSDPADQRS